jgi:hypothetical protein
MPPLEQVTPDTPLRHGVAAAIAFPDGSMTVSGLRREGARGHLIKLGEHLSEDQRGPPSLSPCFALGAACTRATLIDQVKSGGYDFSELEPLLSSSSDVGQGREHANDDDQEPDQPDDD